MKNSDVVTSKDPETGRSTITVRNRPEAFGDWIGFVLLVIASAVLVCVGVVNLGANPVSGVALGALVGAVLVGLCARVHYRYLHRRWVFDVGREDVTVSSKKWGKPLEVSVALQPTGNSVRIFSRTIKQQAYGGGDARVVSGGYTEHRLLCNGKQLLMTNQKRTAQQAADALKAAVAS